MVQTDNFNSIRRGYQKIKKLNTLKANNDYWECFKNIF